MTSKGGSVSRNFRFDSTSATWLEFESKRKGVSLNSLVNNIFRKYSEFDRLVERTEMVTLNKFLLRTLIDCSPADVLEKKAFEYGKLMGRDNLLFWKKKVNVETLKDYIAVTLCEYCNLAEYDMDVETNVMVLTHDLDQNGTIFLRAYLDGLIQGCLGVKIPIQSHHTTITLSFRNLASISHEIALAQEN